MRWEKVARPSQRREMAEEAVRKKGVGVALACRIFGISESCYRYKRKLRDENAEIADWLVRLTSNYRDLELNPRIKPKKRLLREKPEPLAVPEAPNATWSMDFMSDQLATGHKLRILTAVNTTRLSTGKAWRRNPELEQTERPPRSLESNLYASSC